MKLSEIKYQRPDIDKLKIQISEMTEKFDKCDIAEQVKLYKEFEKIQKNIATASSLAYVRFTLDTEDKFYLSEMDFFDDFGPVFEKYRAAFGEKLLNSKNRKQLEKELTPLLFKKYEIAKKAFSDDVISEYQEDNRLCTEYKKLLSSAAIEFNGEVLNIVQLMKYIESPKRQTRKEAYNALGSWLKLHSEEFDDIYDRMVKVRHRTAKKLGFASYPELAYCRMGRNCYTPKDVATFADQVASVWVDLVRKIKAKQAKTLNIDCLMLYDDTSYFLNGNPEPKGTTTEIFQNGQKMYREMSSATGEFIDFMLKNDLFDVMARPKKSCGGYCIDFPDYDMPFIFANFNGTYGDVDVLTHEAGHAFASYLASRNIPLYELQQANMETCEVHSMSMEFFAWKWMDLFFKDGCEDYKKMHLQNAVTFLCYGTLVDRFQQSVYENPEMTPMQRNELWNELENKYRPYLSSKGIEYIEDGTRWQFQSHIFENPFYYIDYCLAQTVALEFLVLMQKDYKEAFDKYIKFLSYGGTKTFLEILDEIGFSSPFEPGSLKNLSMKVEEIL